MRDIKRKIQYNKERYYWFREHKMCGKCGNQDAYTLIGRAYCYECSEKYNCNRPYQYNSQKQKERYNRRKENGICVKCGAKEAREGKTTCASCQSHCSQWRSNKCLTKKSKNNTCSRCAEELDGQINVYGEKSKLCSKCYEEAQKYLEIAWSVNSKIKERNKSIMTTEEIIKRYTEANTKTNCVAKLSKELGVPRSTIIAELLKSGYKYQELQRAMKNDYKAAEAKYKAWVEAGKPEEEIESKVESAEEDAKTECSVNVEYKNEIDVVKLTEELNDAKKAIDILRTDKAELKSIIDKHAERIRGLEEEVEEANSDKVKAEELSEQNIEYLKLRDEELKNMRKEKEELEAKYAAEHGDKANRCDEYLNQIDSLIREKADLCVEIETLKAELQKEKLRADINEDDYNSDTEVIRQMHEESSKLKKRLQKAERFILNSIYEKMEEE